MRGTTTPHNNLCSHEMKSIQTIENEIIQSFEALSTVEEKYALLFELGENLPPMHPDLKTDENLVRGCQSLLWFHLHEEEGRFSLAADSDSMVIKGISALLVRLVEGRTAEEILTIDMDFIDKLKIWKLASKRNNSLMAMLAHIHTRVRLEQSAKSTGLQNSAREDTLKPR